MCFSKDMSLNVLFYNSGNTKGTESGFTRIISDFYHKNFKQNLKRDTMSTIQIIERSCSCLSYVIKLRKLFLLICCFFKKGIVNVG